MKRKGSEIHSQIACHRCGGWATGGPTVAATGAGGPLVHRCVLSGLDVRVAYIRKLAILSNGEPIVTANLNPVFCSYLWEPFDLNP